MAKPYDRIPVTDIEDGFTRHASVRAPNTDAWRDLNEWATTNGLDPHTVLASTGVVRDADAGRIRYKTFALDEDGKRQLARADGYLHEDAVLETDGPPSPFPASIDFGPATRPVEG